MQGIFTEICISSLLDTGLPNDGGQDKYVTKGFGSVMRGGLKITTVVIQMEAIYHNRLAFGNSFCLLDSFQWEP